MRIKSILSLSLATPLIAGLLSISTPAFADTLNFGSYIGTSSSTFANGPVTYGSLGGTQVSETYDWSGDTTPVIAGTTYVTYDDSPNAASGIEDYFTAYTGNIAGDSGTLTVQADDGLTVLLNGNVLGSFPTSDYDTVFNFTINPGDYIDGQNVFEFEVDNAQGYTGVDFAATAVSPTPEPSSLILLGTGILGLVGAARRRLLA